MNYARFQKIAKTQIKRFGQLVTFRLGSAMQYDPIAGETTQEIIEDQVYAVLTSPTQREYGAGLIQIGDAVLLVDGLSLSREPSDTDTVPVGGEEWKVVVVQKVSPSDKVVLYKVYIRRS